MWLQRPAAPHDYQQAQQQQQQQTQAQQQAQQQQQYAAYYHQQQVRLDLSAPEELRLGTPPGSLRSRPSTALCQLLSSLAVTTTARENVRCFHTRLGLQPCEEMGTAVASLRKLTNTARVAELHRCPSGKMHFYLVRAKGVLTSRLASKDLRHLLVGRTPTREQPCENPSDGFGSLGAPPAHLPPFSPPPPSPSRTAECTEASHARFCNGRRRTGISNSRTTPSNPTRTRRNHLPRLRRPLQRRRRRLPPASPHRQPGNPRRRRGSPHRHRQHPRRSRRLTGTRSLGGRTPRTGIRGV